MEAFFSEHVLVKTNYKSDIRRFRCPTQTSFDELCSLISDLYKISSFLVRYVDDEGDLISVTSTSELEEAFRVARSVSGTQTPLLRFTIFRTKESPIFKYVSTPKIILNTNESVPVTTVPTTIAVEEEESKEYPKLDVSEWDAIKKDVNQTDNNTNENKVNESKIEKDEEESKEYPPLPIDDWTPCKKEDNNTNIPKAIEQIELPLPPSLVVTSSSSSSPSTVIPSPLFFKKKGISHQCSELSSNITKECISESETIVQDCDDLANEIRDVCIDFSKQTATETLKYATDFLNTSISIKKEDCEALSRKIADECFALAKDTSEACGKISDDVRDKLTINNNIFNFEKDSLMAGWSELSNATSATTQKLCLETSQSTSQLCSEVSKGLFTLVNANNSNDQDWRNNCEELRNNTLKDCFDYSSSTNSTCLKESDNIRQLIMNL